MSTFYVTAIYPVPVANEPVRHIAHVLTVQVSQGIDWVKRHAEDIATSVLRRPVTALWVSTEPGVGSTAT